LEAKIFCFNVESESELKLIRKIGSEKGLTGIPISLRVNPDVDAQAITVWKK
jgi:diaminopimelate decarboxylase